MIENKAYEIKVVKSKTAKDHTDLTKPLKAKQFDPNRPAGNYFILNLLARKVMINGVNTRPQTGVVQVVLFDDGNHVTKFNDLIDALSKEENFTKTESGLAIAPTVMGINGKYLRKATPGNRVYKVLQADGKPLLIATGSRKGQEATRSEVRFFVFDDEDEDTAYAAAIARIPKDAWIEATANDDDNPDETASA